MSIRKTIFAVSAVAYLVSGCMHLKGESTEMASRPTAPPPAAPSQSLPVPSYAAGDQWVYSDGYGLRVNSIRPDGLARFDRLDAPNEWFVSKAIFREEAQSSRVHRAVVFRTGDPMQIFTAPVGQTVSFVREYMRNGELIRHRTSWVIEGRERITVPAGSFDTWVLVMRSDSLTSNWRGYERWYYSPQVKNYVRLEYKYGDAPDGSRVLMTYQIRAE